MHSFSGLGYRGSECLLEEIAIYLQRLCGFLQKNRCQLTSNQYNKQESEVMKLGQCM